MGIRENRCPGCGEAKYFRKSDGVCSGCQRHIEYGKDLEARQKAVKNRLEVTVALPIADYSWPGFYGQIPQSIDHHNGL